VADWRAVIIYPSANIEQSNLSIIADSLASGRITRIYLDELMATKAELPLAVKLAVLTIREGEDAIATARQEIERAQGDRDTIDLISTIIVYKFAQLTRDEVDAMLGIELSQSRVYQDAKAEGKLEGKAEGKTEGKAELVMLLLSQIVGEVPPELSQQIDRLPIGKIEKLGSALLGFKNLSDLTAWLAENR
jgi:predicted transposase/invertase (TIGR01784 family)